MRNWEDIVKEKLEEPDGTLPESVFAEFQARRSAAAPAPASKRSPLAWVVATAIAAGLAAILLLRKPSVPEDSIRIVPQPVPTVAVASDSTAVEAEEPLPVRPLIAQAPVPKAAAPKTVAPKAEEPSFKLTGNVQAQAIKAVYDNDADNTLDNSFLRANIGGKYTSSDFEAVINLRIFSPAFGNKNVTDVTVDQNGNVKATKSAQDRFSADTYYAKYKWDTGFGDFSAQFGRFRTDWTVAGNFGTYVDVHLNKRGFLARDYQHDALGFGFDKGISSFSLLLGTYDNKFDTGYLRAEETVKLGDAKISAAYPSELQTDKYIRRILNSPALLERLH